MKKIGDLVPGDILKVDGIEFKVKLAATGSDGMTTIICEDMVPTPEVMAAYGKLLLLMKKQKEEEQKNAEKPDVTD